MLSIIRAYAGLDDPVPDVDPLAVRDIGALAGARSLGERLTRARALVEHLARVTGGTARVAPEGEEDRPGYLNGRLHLTLRHRHALLGSEAAAALVGGYRDVLVG